MSDYYGRQGYRELWEGYDDSPVSAEQVQELLKGIYVSEEQIQDGAVTNQKVSGRLDAGKVTVGASTNFEKNYDPSEYAGTKDTVNLWKFPDTTYIDGGNLYTGSVTANHIKAGTLTSASGVFGDISADYITTGILDASLVTVKNLSADSLVSGTIDANTIGVVNLKADNITSGRLDAGIVSMKDMLYIYDTSGYLNVGIGMNKGTGNSGGKIILYDDSSTKQRVEFGIDSTDSAGVGNFRNSGGTATVVLNAEGGYGGEMSAYDPVSAKWSIIRGNVGYVGGQKIATESWANNSFASSSHTHNHFDGLNYIDFITTTTTPSAAAGKMYYESGVGLRVYDGSVWRTLQWA